ncbi:MAG: cytochrome d ubiquinol oxidase subunit II [Pseudomonadota bacterium]|jgi:cytochrome d ubiquinol oxidase subunit II|nr:cytochrome d ubiquinol oxidase subunit II [Alphaproteobacteria bacterium]
MPSLEILQLIWWVLLGVLLTAFALTDGFDLGVASLLTILGKTDDERRLLINTIAPIWESNQVWLILGAGAIFAAWPTVYAVAFSTMYGAMFLLLACLIVRPVGLKFRSKMPSQIWRTRWDWTLCITSVIPSLLFGVAVGNAILGLPFTFDDHLMLSTQSVFFSLLNPFTLVTGLVSLTMLIAHGAAYIRLKIDHPIAQKAHVAQKLFSFLSLVSFVAAGLILNNTCFGFTIESMPGTPNILAKTVGVQLIDESGELTQRFFKSHTIIAAMMVFFGCMISMVSESRKTIVGFLGTSLSIIGTIATAGLATFPFILPSTLSPNHSLTVWDASSSRLTLFIMLIAVGVFLPLVLAYIIWTYRVFRKKLTLQDLSDPQMY